MDRIAAGLLIVAAVLAFNAGMLREAFAEDLGGRISAEIAVKPPPAPACETSGNRAMSLLLCLAALQQPSVSGAPQKV
jgi:hypothetical protein